MARTAKNAKEAEVTEVTKATKGGKNIILKCRFAGGKNKGYKFNEEAPMSDFSKEELKDLAGYYEEV